MCLHAIECPLFLFGSLEASLNNNPALALPGRLVQIESGRCTLVDR